MGTKYDDGNLRYDEAVVSFAATALELSGDEQGHGVINFAPATMDGIKVLVERFIAENPAANDFIAVNGKEEFGSAFAIDLGGYGRGFSYKSLTFGVGVMAQKEHIFSLDVVEGDDGWLHIEKMEAMAEKSKAAKCR